MAADLATSVVANLLHEFVGPLTEQSGADITLDLRDVDAGKLTMATYNAAFTLRSTLTIPVPEIAVRHAGDPAAFIAELIDESLKPFGDQVHRAAGAAVTSWEEALNRGR